MKKDKTSVDLECRKQAKLSLCQLSYTHLEGEYHTRCLPSLPRRVPSARDGSPKMQRNKKSEVGALGVITISRGCFERCCSNKITPPYRSNLSFVTLRNLELNRSPKVQEQRSVYLG